MERWKNIPGFEFKYAVSDRGRVYSFITWKYLKPGTGNRGHLHVSLGRDKSRGVHELVLTSFKGPCPPRMEARHLNGIPNDNRLDNLEWNTRSVNMLDKKHHDTSGKHLSARDVMSIKQALALGTKRRAIADKYSISYQMVRYIDIGQSHAEIPTWPNL